MKTFQEVRQVVGLLEAMGIEDGVLWSTDPDGGVRLRVYGVSDGLGLEVDEAGAAELAKAVADLSAIHPDHTCLAVDLVLARCGLLVPSDRFYHAMALYGPGEASVRDLFQAAAAGRPTRHPSGLSHAADAQYRGLLAWGEEPRRAPVAEET